MNDLIFAMHSLFLICFIVHCLWKIVCSNRLVSQVMQKQIESIVTPLSLILPSS